ncbi:MAG: hypothetical protein COT71_02670 [Candidatus Andersenbacteria bacterium CG10_big_fil_rev_8_21_14_0_10_54_11]|uniref:Uncharacterized protein n=1 Tax=Candidatus Andersenbacteria bacterium CG10_big_fil_rev_8_21_14_0_10_54_11 TaxID=1974485 RepID=A0A2M6WZ84_9BACT|nr:MAG: hypothetical protein COT71_02670 [Candidatus Andersenbacteria bacterium CG10_big_fil_rev_8_21_14_0_10_54_11]
MRAYTEAGAGEVQSGEKARNFITVRVSEEARPWPAEKAGYVGRVLPAWKSFGQETAGLLH